MKCPFCKSNDDKVIDSRASNNGEVIRRRRECLNCNRRFTTYERIEETPIIVVKKDMSLTDPFSVFQLLKKHVSRYDIDTVSQITGTPKEKVKEIFEIYASTGGPEKSATIMYAMGWTQHTVGTQIIRTMAMIQNLTMTLDSCQPLSSKWWCNGAILKTRFPLVSLK